MDRRWLAMIVGGSVLTASALRRPPSIGRAWVATLGLACVAAGFLCHGSSARLFAAPEWLRGSAGVVDDAIDRASADSFPASDAPASISASAPSGSV